MDILRRGLNDITAGHTRSSILGRIAFIKHLNYSDQISFDRIHDEFFNEAKNSGLPTNEEKLETLKKNGLWSDAMEKELKDGENMISSLIQNKKVNMNMPSLVKRYNEQIKDEEVKYASKLSQKNELLGRTCEVYARQQVNDYYIFTNLFSNQELTTPLFNESEFDYFGDKTIEQIVNDYNVALEPCTEHNIKKLAMHPLFQNYMALVGENIYYVFCKPIVYLTFYQMRLLSHAQNFRSIYQTHDVSKFPKNVLDDPDLLIDYANAAASAKQEMQQKGAYDPDAINVGMSKEDAKILGIKSENNLASQIAKSGGNVIEWAMKRN